jgi:hypothetical protein
MPVSALALSCVLLAQSTSEPRLPLRVLYASDPDTEYSAGWAEFLSAHTAEVRAVGQMELTPELVRAWDVLVIDGELQENGGAYKRETVRVPLRLADLQGRPVVLMGGLGGRLSTQWMLAGSWGLHGCHCLAPWLVMPSAEERTSVFQTPFPIDEAPRRQATPKVYLEHDPGLPPELDVLRVFATDASEPGYVTRWDFRALPDAEWLASGINSKSAGHVAVLRHGSIVLWGFHGPAEGLTSVGTKLFLNALAYAHAHDGSFVENLRLASPREDLLAFYMRLAPGRPRSERAELARIFPPGFPDSVLEDPSTAPAWFREVRGHLRPAGDFFDLDARCAELGPANDSPAFLEELERRLGAAPDDALALELLARYVPAAPRESASAWLRAHRAELYFTDVGGYVWKLRGERADELRNVRVLDLATEAPLRVRARANEEELVLELDVRAGWHLYARPEGAFTAVALRASPDCAYELGAFAPPGDENGWLTRRVELRVPLRRRPVGEGLALELSFQACDADSCRTPETVRLVH